MSFQNYSTNDTYLQSRNILQPNPSTGNLTVRVFVANQARPIVDANVLVTGHRTNGNNVSSPISNQEERETVFANLQTDINGTTPLIVLQTPPESLSLTPENGFPGVSAGILPYAVYTVKVSNPGYYTFIAEDVQLFANTVSVLPVQLIPLPIEPIFGQIPDTQLFETPPHSVTGVGSANNYINNQGGIL